MMQRFNGKVLLTTGGGSGPARLLLNHISSPHVTLASAVAASCALPGIMQAQPLEANDVVREALVVSALASAERAEELGLPHDRIVISCKVSGVQDLIAVYRNIAARCDYPLHLGLTEAGVPFETTDFTEGFPPFEPNTLSHFAGAARELGPMKRMLQLSHTSAKWPFSERKP